MKPFSTPLNLGKVAGLTACLAAGLSANAAPILNPANGHYYEVISSAGVTWPSADVSALASSHLGLSGYLATICDGAENDFVNSLRVSAGLGQVWLGGFQPVGELVATAHWKWVHGEGSIPGSGVHTHPYSNWAGSEPNDAYGAGSEQYLGIGLFGDSTWNDEGALGLIHGYVVEYGDTVSCVPDAGSNALLGLLALGGLALAQRRMTPVAVRSGK